MKSFFLLSPLLFQVTIWPITRFFLWFWGDLEVKGLENLDNLPKGRGVIFASNHSSEIDPFLPPASLPFMSRFIPLYYTTKERSFYEKTGIQQFFYGGFVFRFIGGCPVYSGMKNYEKSLVNHVQLLNEGHNLFVFPEGGITEDGNLGEAHGGVAYLAEKTGSVVVPIGIYGVYGMSVLDFFSRKRNIKVIFGLPILQSELKINVSSIDDSILSYKKEAEYIMNKIKNLMI